MATCNACGVAKAALFSSMCRSCIANDMATYKAGGTQSTSASSVSPLISSEGDTASLIGNIIIFLSLVSSLICIFIFGKIEIPDGLYATKTQWSPLLVSIYVASGLNGMFFGYLLAKVGSVLSRLERASSVARAAP